MLWSLYNHHAMANDLFYELLNETPGRVVPKMQRPAASIRKYFHEWLERDGYPFWSFWDNIGSWWDARHLPNVLLVHFADLKADLPEQIRRIAEFLAIDIDETSWPAIVEHCSFAYMKQHAAETAPLGGIIWEGGAGTFINRGTNGRWEHVLSESESRTYETIAQNKLGLDCARWLASGGLPQSSSIAA